MEASERCWLCSFWNGNRCTQTFRLTIHVEPLGGQLDFVTTPGMVPEELKPKVNDYFRKLSEKFIIPLIEKMPVWEEIREFQEGHHREHCPGMEERKELKNYLHIVRP